MASHDVPKSMPKCYELIYGRFKDANIKSSGPLLSHLVYVITALILNAQNRKPQNVGNGQNTYNLLLVVLR